MTRNRRFFLHAVGAGVVSIPLSALTRRASISAAELPKVDLNDPTAKALEYTHDSVVDGQSCRNCQLYIAEESTDSESASPWGTCAIFPGKLVNEEGWCKSWIVKSG